MTTVTPPVHFLNIAYFFQLIYNLIFSVHTSGSVGSGGGFSFDSLELVAIRFWLVFVVLSYIATLVLLGVLIYYTIRLHEVAAEDDARFETIAPEEAHAEVENSRWKYIRELIEGTQQSDWRNAIIEADIMLDELLSKQQYEGESVGEKLRAVNPDNFATLDDAWTAHRVRNEIAHQGSTYELSAHTAYQTIARYENVFREFNEI